jgi:hypothetical protein
MAAKVYLCGLRPRKAALEISTKLHTPQYESLNLKDLIKAIIQNAASLSHGCTDTTLQWFDILVKQFNKKNDAKSTEQLSFELPEETLPAKSNLLYFRKLDKQIFLCSLDYAEKILFTPTFSMNEKDMQQSKIYFRRVDSKWVLFVK